MQTSPEVLPQIRVRRGETEDGAPAIMFILSDKEHPIVMSPTSARRLGLKLVEITKPEDVG